MITIIKQEKNNIYYDCSCGAIGMCSFKPTNKEAAIIIDIKCPACLETERMLLLQYNNEESKKTMINNIEDMDLSWVPSINEEILNYNGEE